MSFPQIRTIPNNFNPMHQLVTSPDSLSHSLSTTTSPVSTHPSSASLPDPNIFICNQCVKIYTQKKTFERHLRVHTGKNRYVCSFEQCGKKFKLLIRLQAHLRSQKHRTHDVIELGQEPVPGINQIPQGLIDRIPISFFASPSLPLMPSTPLSPNLVSAPSTSFSIPSSPTHSLPIPAITLPSTLPPTPLNSIFNPLSPVNAIIELDQESVSGINQISQEQIDGTSSSFFALSFPSPMPSTPSSPNVIPLPTPRSHSVSVAVPENSKKKFPCNKCDKSFATKGTLNGHLIDVHKGETPYVCPTCYRGFKRPQRLKIHQYVHTGERLYVCSFARCSKSFSDNSSLKRHQCTHTGEKPYVCPFDQCNKKFSLKQGLERHQRTQKHGPHDGIELDQGPVLEIPQSLIDRMLSSFVAPSPSLSSVPSTPSFSFPPSPSLSSVPSTPSFSFPPSPSLSSVPSTPSFSFPLMPLDSIFNPLSTSVHDKMEFDLESVSGINQISQEQVDETSNSFFALSFPSPMPSTPSSPNVVPLPTPLSHIVPIAVPKNSKKTIPCKKCGKGFASISTLKDHQIHHTGIKPHVCSICKKGFIRRALLKEHQSAHTGIKPYECGQCNKKYSLKTSLNRHTKDAHAGIKPYECGQCNKKYSVKRSLNYHTKKAHPGF